MKVKLFEQFTKDNELILVKSDDISEIFDVFNQIYPTLNKKRFIPLGKSLYYG